MEMKFCIFLVALQMKKLGMLCERELGVVQVRFVEQMPYAKIIGLASTAHGRVDDCGVYVGASAHCSQWFAGRGYVGVLAAF
ncbi:hypothetical protein RC52_25845 [Herbaspirillum rubrisubalbicans]|nr:hypothetical protein [Herbaspirillum rubrisubalbicans]